jgi:hypothetical protein
MKDYCGICGKKFRNNYYPAIRTSYILSLTPEKITGEISGTSFILPLSVPENGFAHVRCDREETAQIHSETISLSDLWPSLLTMEVE